MANYKQVCVWFGKELCGDICIPMSAWDAMIAGHRQRLFFDDVATVTGMQFSSLLETMLGRPQGRNVLDLRAEPGRNGKKISWWEVQTNAAGNAFVKQACAFEDALLFRHWIHSASDRPGTVARFLSGCTDPNDYRVALGKLIETKGQVEGGIA